MNLGKYGTLGAIVLVVTGFLLYFTGAFTGDLQSNSVIEPVNATMTVGNMRLKPYNGYGTSTSVETPNASKGVRAMDFITEVTNQLEADKPANTVYKIDWVLKTSSGKVIDDVKPILSGSSNPVVVEAEYTINRYDATQVDSKGKVKDVKTPMNSTTYRWSVYVDADARTGSPVGLGATESSVRFMYNAGDLYTDRSANILDGDSNGYKDTTTQDGLKEPEVLSVK